MGQIWISSGAAVFAVCMRSLRAQKHGVEIRLHPLLSGLPG